MVKIYRKPAIVCSRPWDEGSAYTMRLLNFLFKLKMKGQSNIHMLHIDPYVRRLLNDKNLIVTRYCPIDAQLMTYTHQPEES